MVADEHVDRAGLVDRLADGVVVPDVGAEDGDVHASGEADGAAGLLELFGVAGEDGDAGAVGGGAAGEGEADAAGAAGDEDVAAFDWDLDRAGADEEGEENQKRGGD